MRKSQMSASSLDLCEHAPCLLDREVVSASAEHRIAQRETNGTVLGVLQECKKRPPAESKAVDVK